MLRKLKLSYRAFTLADLDLFELLPDERAAIEANANELSQWADKGMDAGYSRRCCVTALFDGKPLLITGMYEIERGVAQVFVIPDKRAKKFRQTLIASTRICLRWIEGRPWCERIQTASLPLEHIDRWMTSLGFACAGWVRGYTGQDYKLWERVKLNGIWNPIQTAGRTN